MTENNSKLNSPYPLRREVHAKGKTEESVSFPTRRELHGQKLNNQKQSIPAEVKAEEPELQIEETSPAESVVVENVIAESTPPLPTHQVEGVGEDPQVFIDVSDEDIYPEKQPALEEVSSKKQPSFDEIVLPIEKPSPKKPILSIIALITAIVGFVFGILPGFLIVGWVLLPIAFILSIVALAVSRKKTLSIIALILTVLGIVASALVFFFFVGNAFEEAFEEIEVQQSAEVVAIESSSFGSKHTWADGLSVTVFEPGYFELDEAEKEQSIEMGLTPLIFTVEVENGTDRELESNEFYSAVTSTGEEATPIYNDSEELVFLGETIKPGDSLTYRVAYLVENPVNLEFEWRNLGSENEAVVFHYDEMTTNA